MTTPLNPQQFPDNEAEDVFGALGGTPMRKHVSAHTDEELHDHMVNEHGKHYLKHGYGGRHLLEELHWTHHGQMLSLSPGRPRFLDLMQSSSKAHTHQGGVD
jgi:hypothetical protein